MAFRVYEVPNGIGIVWCEREGIYAIHRQGILNVRQKSFRIVSYSKETHQTENKTNFVFIIKSFIDYFMYMYNYLRI